MYICYVEERRLMQKKVDRLFPYEGGIEYLHRRPARRKRRRKGNPVPGVSLGHPVPRHTNTGTWSSRLEESQEFGQ
jgi:hypothetical protein